MDFELNKLGDIVVTPLGDISLVDSVSQKIKIKLGWHEGEWQWDESEGLPYMEYIFIKIPDTDSIERMVREKIFEIPEIVEVRDVQVTVDSEKRVGKISFTACTDYETIREELSICRSME